MIEYNSDLTEIDIAREIAFDEVVCYVSSQSDFSLDRYGTNDMAGDICEARMDFAEDIIDTISRIRAVKYDSELARLQLAVAKAAISEVHISTISSVTDEDGLIMRQIATNRCNKANNDLYIYIRSKQNSEQNNE